MYVDQTCVHTWTRKTGVPAGEASGVAAQHVRAAISLAAHTTTLSGISRQHKVTGFHMKQAFLLVNRNTKPHETLLASS